MRTKTLAAALTIRALGDESEITITTPGRDLMADTIDPMGMDVSRYLNGTRAVNFAHDHGRLPVGKTVSLSKTPQGIRARFRWLGANPEARVVRDVFQEGVLGASVEFLPVEREPNRSGGVHFSQSILTGWALTSNPANPECVRMVKSLGLDREDEPVLFLAGEDDADEVVTIEPADVVVGLHTVLGQRVRDEVRRQARGLVGVAEEETYLVVTDADEPGPVVPGDPVLIEVNEDLGRIIGEALGAVVHREVRGAINALRGRVD